MSLTCLSCSSGPNVQVFVRLKNRWSSTDVDKYQTGYDDNETSCILAGRQSVVDEVVSFIHTTLQSELPRDDYREPLELVLIFLGQLPERGSTAQGQVDGQNVIFTENLDVQETVCSNQKRNHWLA